MQRALCAVAALALGCLAIRAARVGLAGDYIDPIGKITAQDEAVYAHGAIRMAIRGDWLTPRFMDRYALFKPPLLLWASGLSARILGISSLSLRLPDALLCALAAGLVFLWASGLGSWHSGAAAVLLLCSNHLWHVLGGMCLTDGLLVAFYVAAMSCLLVDPRLESRAALWGFAASVAAAILTKSVAGFPPLAALALYRLLAPPKLRPSLARAGLAAALPLALAAPWFAWQLAVHGRWFRTEHVLVEILGFGAGSPPQTSAENQAFFYALRMAAVDPVLLALSLVAVPGFVRALRRRSAPAVLLLSWIAVTSLTVLAWQYRNIAYLLPLVPALAILAAVYGPLSSSRTSAWMPLLAVIALCLKLATPLAPWGISFRAGTVQPAAPLLSAYCEHARGNELIVVGMGDDLYASALPLARLRYALVDAGAVSGRYGMPFQAMGIVLTAPQFDDLARLEPYFRARLREWGLDSGNPVGTLILAASQAELAAIIRSHPDADFLLRASLRPAAGTTHDVVELPGHLLLLSRTVVPRADAPRWSCRL